MHLWATVSKGPYIFHEVVGSGEAWEKMVFEGGHPTKNKGKGEGHVKYLSKTLRWA